MENADLQSTVRTQSREAVPQAQARIREAALIRNRQGKLTALLHHINIDVLRASFSDLKKTAAPGVDEVTWTEYRKRLPRNEPPRPACSRPSRGVSSARFVSAGSIYRRRTADSDRSALAAIEDKIVQAAVGCNSDADP